MPVNQYFNRVSQKNEQELFDSLFQEFIQFGGVDILYLPREKFELDPILKEPVRTVWDKAYRIEVYIPDGGNYEGDQQLMSKFGFRVNQTTDLIMSKTRFLELGTGRKRPREGDLIFIGDPDDPHSTFTNTLFTINQCWYNEPVWQFGKNMEFRLRVETWTGDYNQKFQTGTAALDMQNPDNNEQLDYGINAEVISEKLNLLVFDKNNPFAEN